MTKMFLKIYLISVLICLSSTGERLYMDSKLGKPFDKELTKRDLINSFIPFLNTYYSYLITKELIVGVTKLFK